jgi:hypothetical protein
VFGLYLHQAVRFCGDQASRSIQLSLLSNPDACMPQLRPDDEVGEAAI